MTDKPACFVPLRSKPDKCLFALTEGKCSECEWAREKEKGS